MAKRRFVDYLSSEADDSSKRIDSTSGNAESTSLSVMGSDKPKEKSSPANPLLWNDRCHHIDLSQQSEVPDESNLVLKPSNGMDQSTTFEYTDTSYTTINVDLLTMLTEDSISENNTPYSWMIENPGKVPDCLERNDCHRQVNYQFPQKRRKIERPEIPKQPRYLPDVEKALEEILRRDLGGKPDVYFFTVNGLKSIMLFRLRRLISEQAAHSLVYRLLAKITDAWDIYSRNFIPEIYEFEPYNKKGVRNPALVPLFKQLKDLGESGRKGWQRLLWLVMKPLFSRKNPDGYLIYASDLESGPTFHALAQDRLSLSSSFMRTLGKDWPFPVPIEEADIHGILKVASEEWHK